MPKRRDFLKAGAASALASLPSWANEYTPLDDKKTVKEPLREIPIVRETDVIVCGGGPAGVGAALSAARSGAKTTLIELHGCLGGVWTASLLSNIIDHEGKPGIMKEIIERLDTSDAQYTAKKYDAELMKWTLEQMCKEAGVEVRLHTRVTAAYQNKNKKIDYITTESFSGREGWALFDRALGAIATVHEFNDSYLRAIAMIRLSVRTQFDARKLQRKTQSATFRSLGHAGAAIRLTARRSIRRRKKPSRPGSPPHTQTGHMKRVFRYEVSSNKTEVLIGPVNEFAGTIWNLHEFGGRAKGRRLLKAHRFQVGEYGPIRIKQRGYNTKFARIQLKTPAQANLATRLIEDENARRQNEVRNYPKRPFMKPALDANRARLPKFWANSVN